jgi:GT2 family glycosyltransferase
MRSNSTSVVVPTWQRALWLERCLAGVEDQSPPPDEIIVVGRAEDIEARSVVASRSRSVRWVEVDRPGHIAPVMRGIEESRGEIVAVLDDDVVPETDWLQALLEPFQDPTVACVGGRVVTSGIRARVHADAGQIRWYGKHVGNVAMLRGPRPIDVAGVMECNWAWRRAILGGLRFDRRLDFDDASMYGLDLTLQALERGFRIIYQPDAIVVNASAPRDPSLDRRDHVARTFSYSRNYSIVASNHLRGVRLAVFWMWWMLVGERGSYGIVGGVMDMLIGRASLAVVHTALRGKVAGARASRRNVGTS